MRDGAVVSLSRASPQSACAMPGPLLQGPQLVGIPVFSSPPTASETSDKENQVPLPSEFVQRSFNKCICSLKTVKQIIC